VQEKGRGAHALLSFWFQYYNIYFLSILNICPEKGGRGVGPLPLFIFGFNVITFISYPFLIYSRKRGKGCLAASFA
jgi:hypothetical protein